MYDDEHQEHDAETFAVMLLPGWRTRTGKLHIRRECRAVQFHRQHMTPVLVRLDDDRECSRVFGEPDELCGYCFAHLGEIAS